jgi:hypothetical protein
MAAYYSAQSDWQAASKEALAQAGRNNSAGAAALRSEATAVYAAANALAADEVVADHLRKAA